MRRFRLGTMLLAAALFLSCGAATVLAAAQRYCPPGGILSTADNASMSIGSGAVYCLHLGAGDGFTQMADGSPMYIFGFQDVVAKGFPVDTLVPDATLGAQFPGPTLRLKEGNTYYVNLTNVGLQNRPDLFDPHTIHFHGFPNQIPFYDGEPMGSFGTNMGATFTYFYQPHDPGTYMFHCHQEAAEHMQMGMLASRVHRPDPERQRGDAGPRHHPRARGLLRSRASSTTTATRVHGVRRPDAAAAGGVRSLFPLERHVLPAAPLRVHGRPVPDVQRPGVPGHGEHRPRPGQQCQRGARNTCDVPITPHRHGN